MKNFLYDKKFRAKLYQVILIVFLIWLIYSIFQNTLDSINERGITTGFSFLNQPSGFAIVQSLIEYTPQSTYATAFFVGLINTILIAVLGVAIATILGFIIGIARLSKNILISSLASIYVEIFRNIPLLLQIFFWYHAILKPLPIPRAIHNKGDIVIFSANSRGIYLPKLELLSGSGFVFFSILLALIVIFGFNIYVKRKKQKTGKDTPLLLYSLLILVFFPLITTVFISINNTFPFSLSYAEMSRFNLKGGFVVIPEFMSLLIALSTYTASFIAEIVRAGIQAVSYGQTEAAFSIGLNRKKTLRLILIPQALRVIIPPLISQYLNLTKNSSLAAAIAYPDIVSVFAGTVLNQTGQALEIIGITMAIYLFLSLVTSLFLNWYNKQILIKER